MYKQSMHTRTMIHPKTEPYNFLNMTENDTILQVCLSCNRLHVKSLTINVPRAEKGAMMRHSEC